MVCISGVCQSATLRSVVYEWLCSPSDSDHAFNASAVIEYQFSRVIALSCQRLSKT